MPELRQSQLPHDIEYCIDAAVEAAELTSAANVALKLYGDATILDNLFENGIDRDGHPVPYSHGRRRSHALAVEAYAGTVIAECSPKRRYALMIMGMHGLLVQTRQTAEWLAHCNYEDETYGGCLKPFRRGRARLTADFRATPRVSRRMHSPRAIRNYLRGIEEIAHLRSLFEVFIRGGKIDDVHVELQPELDAINADLTLQFAAVRAARERVLAEMETAGIGVGMVDIDVTQRLASMGGPKLRLKKEWTKPERRRRIKRAAALAAGIVGASAVSAFARGLPVVIEGNTVAFAVERRVSLDHLGGHASVNVAVCSLTGQRLASLCVYQDATPPLDQLASIALHVAAGEEDLILDTGNLFSIENHDHPAIKSRVERKLAEEIQTVPVLNRGRFDGDSHRERFKAHQEAYVRETADIYRSAIQTIAFGRRASRFIANIEAAT